MGNLPTKATEIAQKLQAYDAVFALGGKCLDHMIVFGEAHLRRILGRYAIMNRAFIARWTRMPHSTGRLSAAASSHHSPSSAAFITNIAESDFRHAQVAECTSCPTTLVTADREQLTRLIIGEK
jgi:hypothetical protein